MANFLYLERQDHVGVTMNLLFITLFFFLTANPVVKGFRYFAWRCGSPVMALGGGWALYSGKPELEDGAGCKPWA